MNEKTKKILSSFYFQALCRLILGGLFIYAGYTKIQDLHGFAQIIYNYKILPGFLVTISAIVLPWVEIAAGTFLVVGLFKRTASVILSGLLLVFILAIAFNLLRGLNFDCGCFSTVKTGAGSDPVGLLIRDFLLLSQSKRANWPLNFEKASRPQV